MAPKFDQWQQIFSISLLSNAVYTKTGSALELQLQLGMKIDEAFIAWSGYIGGWTSAWGPVVFQNTGDQYADNAMFVASGTDADDNPVYVVSIAATNQNSAYDWQQEDFAVNTVVPWANAFSKALGPYGAPTNLTPYLSSGTALGVNNLLAMESGGDTLAAFLKRVQSTDATLIFTGHSLAGALSPTLALALFNPDGGLCSAASWGSVRVYPSAGATPGNADFSTFFQQVFAPVAPPASGGAAYQSWNQVIWNSLDVVPYAWQLETLAQLITFYGVTPAQLFTYIELLGLTAELLHLSQEGAATAGPYTQLSMNQIAGQFNTQLPITDIFAFKAQASYQHVTAYIDLLGIQDLPFLSDTAAPLGRAAAALLERRAGRRAPGATPP